VADLPLMEELTTAEFQERAAEPDTIVLDTRSYLAFGSQHVPGGLASGSEGQFPHLCRMGAANRQKDFAGGG
jgi:hydroxyacylglutathione hydrolase